MSEGAPFRLGIRPNLPDGFFIPSSVQVVQFDERLSERDLTILGRELYHRPEIALRVFGHSPPESYTDLDFLYHFPNVRDLQIDLWSLSSLGGLRAIRALNSFSFGETRTKRHSLAFLSRFSTLRELYIDGHTKDIDVLSGLNNLETLTFRCITLKDLNLLTNLKELRKLRVRL